MTRKKTNPPQIYAILDSSRLDASPIEVTESGTVRMALILDLIAESLEPFPEALHAVSTAIATRLGSSPDTRILP